MESTPNGGDVATRLREARTSYGMTRAELARRTGISRSNLARFEYGQREPRASAIIAIAQALNTTPNVLLGFETQSTTAGAA